MRRRLELFNSRSINGGRIGSWLLDLRRAGRSFSRAPGYSLTSVLLFALGIGSAVAVWSAARQVWGGALPLADAERLVRLVETRQGAGGETRRVAMGAPAFHAARGLSVFSSVTAQRYHDVAWVPVDAAGSEAVTLIAVADRWAETLGVDVAQGRLFLPEEERAGAAADVVLISDAFWRNRLGADPEVLGRRLRLDGGTATVVGVLPRGFSYPYGAEVWRPEVFQPTDLSTRTLNVQARLAPRVGQEAAQRALESTLPELRRQWPEAYGASGVLVRPTRLDLVQGAEAPLRVVSWAVGLILLLTVANLAALATARALRARREVAVRSALGASASRSADPLLLECGVIGLAGAPASLWVAHLLARYTAALVPDPLRTVIDRIALGGSGLAAVALMSLGAFALLAALSRRVARVDDLASGLRSGRGASAGDGRALSGLVSVQVAVTAVVLAGALWAAVALRDRLQHEVGFETRDLSVASIALPADPYADPQIRRDTLAALVASSAAIPGVERVGTVNLAPFSGSGRLASLEAEGQPADAEPVAIANQRVVDPGYLGTLGVGLFSGRMLDATDRAGSQPVALVGRSLARRLAALAGDSEGGSAGRAIGRRVRLRGVRDAPWMTIVGEVGDVAYDSGPDAIAETIYVPLAQTAERSTAFSVLGSEIVLRSSLDPGRLLAALRLAIARTRPEAVVRGLQSVGARRVEQAAEVRAGGAMLAVFALAALLLAAVGIHGILAFDLAARGKELAIRKALGATPLGISGWQLGRISAPVARGLGAAALIGWLSWRGAATLRAEWPALPAALLAVVVLALLVVVSLASLRGLMRARRLPLTTALRED